MKTRTFLKFAATASAALVVWTAHAAVSPCEESAQADALTQGNQLYQQRQWVAAFDQFSRLADDCGHGDAARLAYLMQRYARRIYGASVQFTITPEQVQRWAHLSGESAFATAGTTSLAQGQ